MKIKIILLLLIYNSIYYSQTEIISSIGGKIIDSKSESPIIDATIRLYDLNNNQIKASKSDINGDFYMSEIPIGKYNLICNYVGYNDFVLNNLEIISSKSFNVNIKLSEIVELKEIVILANDKKESINQLNKVSSRTLSMSEANKFSGTYGDVSRMAMNYAGVSLQSDERNDIIIRGNSPLGLLWKMEGVDIPSPNHFATFTSTGGPVSMLNSNLLANSDFITSAWSAEYGNATSGVFDLTMKNGNHNDYEHIFQVGFNGFELGSEGPFKKGNKASYMINARYSSLKFFNLIGIDFGTGNAIPEYQDITMKINLPTKKNGVFSLWSIAGTSNIDFEIDTTANNLFSDEDEETRMKAKTIISGLTHKYFFNNNLFLKNSLSYSYISNLISVDSAGILNNIKKKMVDLDRKASYMNYNSVINWKINSKSLLNGGIYLKYNPINIKDSVRQDNGNLFELYRFNDKSFLMQSFINYEHSFNNKNELVAGLHYSKLFLNNTQSIDPRIAYKLRLNEKHSFSVGFGIHSQTQNILTYLVQSEPDKIKTNINLKFSKSIHSVLSYDLFISQYLRLKTEIYYQHLYNIPVEKNSSYYSIINEGADFELILKDNLNNNGLGKNYGIELTLEKFLNKNYYYLFTISLYNSKYTPSNNIELNTSFNTNFVCNFLFGKEIEINKKSKLLIDTKLVLTGGKRFTPINLEDSKLYGTEILDLNQYLSKRHRNYFKWDFSIGYKLNGKRVSQEWKIDLSNLTNQANIFDMGYDNDSKSILYSYQRGFFPIALYKIYF